jgi:alginate O-acetyltransferase complex protein AlgI
LTFTTLTFALFLALVFALYWAAPGRRGQNVVLLAASYLFYGWWDPRFCALLLGSSLVDFVLARALAREPPQRRRQALLALSVVVNLGLLALFKYFGFFVASFAVALEALGLRANLPSLTLILPVGISFYTFQTLGYTVDVYRRTTPAATSLLDYLAYVALFPQLVAGPIERAGRLLPQLQRARVFDPAGARDGAKQMLWGLAKKVVLADHLGQFVDQIYVGPVVHASGPVLAVATLAFAVQIYCDFSGYSDIAIGCARLLGIDLVRNFAHPYFSRSVAEFWRRWHMSLSTWFRDYVYVPLGGSRRGPARLWLSLMATFTLSGLWHGANWTFVSWGAVNGLLVGLSGVRGRDGARLGPDDPLPSLGTAAGLRTLPRMLATFALICLTWVLFRAEDLAQAMGIYAKLFGELGSAQAWPELRYHREFLDAFAPLVLGLVVVEWWTRTKAHPLALDGWPRPLRWTLYTLLLWATIYLMPEEPDAFMYFQF